MKIALFIDDITKDGGTERCTVELANQLAERGINTTIITVNASNREAKYSILPAIKIVKFNDNKLEHSLKRRIKTINCLRREINTNDYDVFVVVDTLKTLLFIPLVFSLRHKHTKLISWEHFNYCSDEKYTSRWFARKISAIISDVVVVLSEQDCQNWKNARCSEKKLKTIYNYSCFDSNPPQFNRNKKKILAIGRLEDQKGFDFLLQIWRKIEEDQELNDWTLQIVGSGSKEVALHKQAEELEIERVEWYPFTKKIDRFYKDSSIYVMTSRMEGFALVLLEAQAYGLPIVSFNIKCGPSEIVEQDINGYLIEPFDIDDFAAKLSKLMKTPSLLEKFTNNSQNNMEKFDKKTIIDQWVDMFNDLCNPKSNLSKPFGKGLMSSGARKFK